MVQLHGAVLGDGVRGRGGDGCGPAGAEQPDTAQRRSE